MQQPHSAKTLRPYLLQVLGDISRGDPTQKIPHEDTYDPVFRLAGITDIQSYDKNNGQPIPYRWVQWAFQSLREAGLAMSAGRGIWQITEEGIMELRKLQGTEDTEGPVGVQGVSLNIGIGNPEDYHEDPYIRMLAVSPVNTPCFGNYSPEDTLCEACPVRGMCLNATAGTFTRLAQELAAEDARKAKLADIPSAPETNELSDILDKLKPAQPAGKPGFFEGLNLRVGVRRMSAVIPAQCRKCQQTIEQGAMAVWVKNPGVANAALFHEQCYDDALNGV